MIYEYALRKVEFYLHHFCLDKNIKPIIDNLLYAANRGYSRGTYVARGHYVVAPKEDPSQLTENYEDEFLWPFTSESQARHFLYHLKSYFDMRGAKVEVFGIEGYVAR